MDTKDQQTLLLAIYKENCDHARHHEVQRERVTAIVGQTSGLVLGLFGFAEAWDAPEPIHIVLPVFLILLGLWGFAASWKHNERSALHRERVRECRRRLSAISGMELASIAKEADERHRKAFGRRADLEARTHVIWKAFNLLIAALGAAIWVYLCAKL